MPPPLFAVAAILLFAQHPARTVWLVGIPLIVIVAASRLYLGAHHLSDVIASAVIASGTVLIAAAGRGCSGYATAKRPQQRDDTTAADQSDGDCPLTVFLARHANTVGKEGWSPMTETSRA